MAAISSISNGEALSSVRTKLNNVITEINLLDPTDWVDYSATSTIVGWSSFTTKIIKYRVLGKQVFVYCVINGTSNSTTTSFTLPNNVISENLVTITHCVSNGSPVLARCILIKNSNNITFDYFSNFSVISSFSSEGVKSISCIFNFQIA